MYLKNITAVKLKNPARVASQFWIRSWEIFRFRNYKFDIERVWIGDCSYEMTSCYIVHKCLHVFLCMTQNVFVVVNFCLLYLFLISLFYIILYHIFFKCPCGNTSTSVIQTCFKMSWRKMRLTLHWLIASYKTH